MIIVLKDDQLHFLVFSLIVLFIAIGISIFHYQQNEHKARVVRDYQNVLALEARLDRFDQVIATYNINPIIAKNEASYD